MIQLQAANIRSLFSALVPLGYRPSIPVTEAQFADIEVRRGWIAQKGMSVLNLHSNRFPDAEIDIFVAEPFDFDIEYERAYQQPLAEGLIIRIAALDTLIEMKPRAGRPKDLAYIDELERIRKSL